MPDLRTDSLLNFTSDIKTRIINKGVEDPGPISPKQLGDLIDSIQSGGGEPNFLRIKMTQIIDGDTCEIQLETEETPNGFLGYIENDETQEINLIQEI